MSVPARLRTLQFVAVCCSAESAHLQADSVYCSSLQPTRVDSSSQLLGLPATPVRAARTLRRWLLNVPGRLTRHARGWTLHLPARWPWHSDYSRALDRIRALPTAAT